MEKRPIKCKNCGETQLTAGTYKFLCYGCGKLQTIGGVTAKKNYLHKSWIGRKRK